jgi:hypothetical protein
MINLSPQSPREKARSRQHPLALRRRASPFWLIALLALCLILAIVLALPQPMTMVAASIRSETIRIEILNPDASSTTLPRARHVETGTCFSDITVRPDFGAIVNYTRRIGSPLYISFTGGVSWHKENRLAGSSTDGAYFKLDPDDKDCLTEGNVRLPVNGMMMAGMDTSGNDGTEPSLSPLPFGVADASTRFALRAGLHRSTGERRRISPLVGLCRCQYDGSWQVRPGAHHRGFGQCLRR